jgi:hypothetical protein
LDVRKVGLNSLPWLIILAPMLLFPKLIFWAKKRKSAAVALVVFVHMFLPDPNVKKTIATVVQAKQQVKKRQDESGEPL